MIISSRVMLDCMCCLQVRGQGFCWKDRQTSTEIKLTSQRARTADGVTVLWICVKNGLEMTS